VVITIAQDYTLTFGAMDGANKCLKQKNAQ